MRNTSRSSDIFNGQSSFDVWPSSTSSSTDVHRRLEISDPEKKFQQRNVEHDRRPTSRHVGTFLGGGAGEILARVFFQAICGPALLILAPPGCYPVPLRRTRKTSYGICLSVYLSPISGLFRELLLAYSGAFTYLHIAWRKYGVPLVSLQGLAAWDCLGLRQTLNSPKLACLCGR